MRTVHSRTGVVHPPEPFGVQGGRINKSGDASKPLNSTLLKSTNYLLKFFVCGRFPSPFLKHSNHDCLCHNFKALFSVNVCIILSDAEVFVLDLRCARTRQDLTCAFHAALQQEACLICTMPYIWFPGATHTLHTHSHTHSHNTHTLSHADTLSFSLCL